MSVSDNDLLHLKWGGRWDFWLSELPVVARFIDAHARELTKVRVAGQAPVAVAAESELSPAETRRALIWDPTRGGMRMPHLHYSGEIYMLNDHQWADFSKGALSALVQRLGKAQAVPFEKVMELSESMSGM